MRGDPRLRFLVTGGLAIVAAVMSALVEPPLGAQRESKPVRALALARVGGAASLRVSSPSIMPGRPIPERFTDYGQKFSPALRWSGAPQSTRSFVLLMEDPDAKEPTPFVHWILYNLPASITELHEAVPTLPRLPSLGAALQGRTSKGTIGYYGPRPPRGDAPHHYHFQVFALDTMLTVDPMADRETVLEAMKSHVLAAGEIVGTFGAPSKP